MKSTYGHAILYKKSPYSFRNLLIFSNSSNICSRRPTTNFKIEISTIFFEILILFLLNWFYIPFFFVLMCFYQQIIYFQFLFFIKSNFIFMNFFNFILVISFFSIQILFFLKLYKRISVQRKKTCKYKFL